MKIYFIIIWFKLILFNFSKLLFNLILNNDYYILLDIIFSLTLIVRIKFLIIIFRNVYIIIFYIFIIFRKLIYVFIL